MSAKIIDLTGKRFGKLVVLSLSPLVGNAGQRKWDCVCDCGNSHLVTGESLRSGKSKSCGCLLFKCRFAANDNTDRVAALLRAQYSAMKKRQRKKFDIGSVISFQKFRDLTFADCFYCGSAPLNKMEDSRYDKGVKIIVTKLIIETNGIDRIDSNKGYEADNVVSCCKHCNTAKNSLSLEGFRRLICQIYHHWAAQTP